MVLRIVISQQPGDVATDDKGRSGGHQESDHLEGKVFAEVKRPGKIKQWTQDDQRCHSTQAEGMNVTGK